MATKGAAKVQHKPHKYRAQHTWVCPRCMLMVSTSPKGHPSDCPGELVRFDSKAEAQHYRRLSARARAGAITDLRRQVRWPIYAGGQVAAHYVADFQYQTVPDGQLCVEDVKGYDTDLSKLKRKLVEMTHGITVELIDKAGRVKR